jgi:hypothetical protein
MSKFVLSSVLFLAIIFGNAGLMAYLDAPPMTAFVVGIPVGIGAWFIAFWRFI